MTAELIQKARERAAQQVSRQLNSPRWAGPRPLVFPNLDGLAAPEDFAFAPLAALRAALDAKALTSEELTRMFLRRIQRVDAGAYRSVIAVNPEALDEARAADAGGSGHLRGIPVLVKDNIGTRGPMPTTAGAWALRDAVCDRDSAVVARLRAAGAVILGKTNLSEFANWMSDGMPNGFSSVGGQTRNARGPFDVSGSSSGSAVAAALGLCAAAIGSETWGSLIAPACANGVVTLKPSLGVVSRDRIVPITEAQDTAGPMARSVADLAVLMNAIAGPDPADPETEAARALAGIDYAAGLDSAALRGKRIGIVRQSVDVDDEAPAWRARLAVALEAAGATPVPLAPAPVDESVFRDDFLIVGHFDFKRGLDAYLTATGAPFRTLAELVAWNAEDPGQRVPWGQSMLSASAAATTAPELYRAIRDRNRAAAGARLDALLAEGGCDWLAGAGPSSYIPFAVAGAPAVALPMGEKVSGEPVGATLIGRFLDDARLLGAAFALERALGRR